MKNIYKCVLLLLIAAFTIISCGKEGLQGPDGPQGSPGPAGPTGPAGAVGPAGKDGSIIYSGTGAPAAVTGVAGDYYLNKTTGDLYGPKTANGWGAPTGLKGAQGAAGNNGNTGATGAAGAAGTPGSKILSGTGAPSNTQGSAGDYYLDKTNLLLYGPKSTSWGTPVLLRGQQGAQGPVGPAGADGSIIYSGSGAPDPVLGKNGDYYFDKTTGGLYGPKTVSGWGSATSLVGPQGATGATGTTGATGAAGSDGATILSGNGAPALTLGKAGDFYLDLSNYFFYGPKTASGWGTRTLLKGAQGAQGPVGPAGADGSIIYSGSGAPDPALGKNGDYYFDKVTGGLYGPKTTSGWGSATSLVGPQGATGTTGATGSTGAAGSAGATILSGNGAPSPALGKVGDFYLDLSTYFFYGPKTASGWGTRTLLKGAQGAQGPVGPAGADGSIIYSGTGVPDPAVGTTGDYYFDKSGRSLYGPKTAAGWGTAISLVGATGATGATGGTGATGADGSTILSGLGAPGAATGKIGDFYLDRSTYLFYGPKNVDGWGPGVSLKGAPGSGANVTAFQTSDTDLLQWNVYGGATNGPPANFVLRHQRFIGDSVTFFRLPDSVYNAVRNGVILVYAQIANPADTTVHQWIQLPYTNVIVASNIQSYTFRSVATTNGTSIRVFCNISNATTQLSPLFSINKLRVIITPQTVNGTLNVIKNQPSIKQVMRQLSLTDRSFKTVK